MATFTIPSRQYPAGDTAFGPINIPAGVSSLNVTLTRESWPDSQGQEIIEIKIFANGTFLCAFGMAGGVLPNDKFGNPVTTSSLAIQCPSPFTLTGVATLQQPLTTAIAITAA